MDENRSAFAEDYAAKETSFSSQAHLRHDSDDMFFTSSPKGRFGYLSFDGQSIWIDSERWIRLTLTLWESTHVNRLPQLKTRIAHPLKARQKVSYTNLIPLLSNNHDTSTEAIITDLRAAYEDLPFTNASNRQIDPDFLTDTFAWSKNVLKEYIGVSLGLRSLYYYLTPLYSILAFFNTINNQY